MAELNLNQITEKLNKEFTGETRKLVFWYDADGEFAEDVDTLDLVNAKVFHLEPDNQFYTKYFLECVDTTTNYLVYAPFTKPSIRENHLADTIRYSKEFFADRASLLALDLGIDERYKPVLRQHIKFFAEKRRTQAFYDLELDTFNKDTIEVALMSVLCKCKTSSYEEVLRTVLLDGDLVDSTYLVEFEKYGLRDAFWKQAEDLFGYVDETPTLEKLAMTLFITYIERTITAELPAAWNPFVSFKGGSSVAFLDHLMNSYLYSEQYDTLSEKVYRLINGAEEFARLPVEALAGCGAFAGIDALLIRWVTERLLSEDVGAKLGDTDIPQLAKIRRHQHFGRQCRDKYFVLENAWHIIARAKYEPSASLEALVKCYIEDQYQMDRYYRCFYYYLDKVYEREDGDGWEDLKELVENIYTNEYLMKICANWNQWFAEEAGNLEISQQADFYHQNLQYAKEQTVVIISDALRYEVGMSLLEKLQADEKCTAQIKPMLSVLPSITAYGMAALLPHETLSLTADFEILVDGKKVETTEQRQDVLQQYRGASKCVRYDEIKAMNVADLRSVFNRQDVVYVYHNQIDAIGDKLNTENQVFKACEEAIDNICGLIRRLTTSANKSHFIVTADHGFLYKRRRLTESDKIGKIFDSAAPKGRRYLLSEQGVTAAGVASLPVGMLMGSDDERVVSFPMGAELFKAHGTGMNYVHGGSSPQEMLVPLIEVKTAKSYRETKTVQIAPVSLMTKLTNLITSLDFVQTEAISDVVKETTYRIFFVSDRGEKVSNEQIYVADKKDSDTVKRVFRLRFSLKNRKYDKSQRYYLVAVDEATGLELFRREMVIDIAFADDYGFGL